MTAPALASPPIPPVNILLAKCSLNEVMSHPTSSTIMASVFAAVNVARSSELVCVSAPPAIVSTNNRLAELGQPQGHLAISMWI